MNPRRPGREPQLQRDWLLIDAWIVNVPWSYTRHENEHVVQSRTRSKLKALPIFEVVRKSCWTLNFNLKNNKKLQLWIKTYVSVESVRHQLKFAIGWNERDGPVVFKSSKQREINFQDTRERKSYKNMWWSNYLERRTHWWNLTSSSSTDLDLPRPVLSNNTLSLRPRRSSGIPDKYTRILIEPTISLLKTLPVVDAWEKEKKERMKS